MLFLAKTILSFFSLLPRMLPIAVDTNRTRLRPSLEPRSRDRPMGLPSGEPAACPILQRQAERGTRAGHGGSIDRDMEKKIVLQGASYVHVYSMLKGCSWNGSLICLDLASSVPFVKWLLSFFKLCFFVGLCLLNRKGNKRKHEFTLNVLIELDPLHPWWNSAYVHV